MKSDILIRPIISEKSMAAASKNRFTFEVAITANKNAITTEVAKVFKVTPQAIQTITVPGKIKLNRRNRRQIVEQKWKKAVITLPKGQKIDLFDVTEVPAETKPEVKQKEIKPEVKKETKQVNNKEIKKVPLKGAKRDA